MRRLRLFAVFACLAAADCGDDPAYVHVYVQGSGAASGNALTSQPFTLDVVAFGDGQRADLSYPTHLRPPDGPTTSPFTDFLLDVSARPQDPFDLRFVTKGVADNVPWGGDAHLASPVAGQSIVVTLTRGEDRPFKDELFSLLEKYRDGVAFVFMLNKYNQNKFTKIKTNLQHKVERRKFHDPQIFTISTHTTHQKKPTDD